MKASKDWFMWERMTEVASTVDPKELAYVVPSPRILIEPSQERDGQNEREQAVAERSPRRWDEIKREGKQAEQQGGNAQEDAGNRTALRAAAARWIAVILLPPAVRYWRRGARETGVGLRWAGRRRR